MLHCKRNSTRKFYKHWTKQLEHLSPPSPQIKDGNVARLGVIDFLGGRGAGWGIAAPFYSVQDCSPYEVNSKMESFLFYSRGRGYSLIYRYVPPHRVGFLRRFCLKRVHTDFAYLGLESVLLGNYVRECVNVFIVSIPVRKRNMRIRNGFEEFFCLRSYVSNDNIISA